MAKDKQPGSAQESHTAAAEMLKRTMASTVLSSEEKAKESIDLKTMQVYAEFENDVKNISKQYKDFGLNQEEINSFILDTTRYLKSILDDIRRADDVTVIEIKKRHLDEFKLKIDDQIKIYDQAASPNEKSLIPQLRGVFDRYFTAAYQIYNEKANHVKVQKAKSHKSWLGEFVQQQASSVKATLAGTLTGNVYLGVFAKFFFDWRQKKKEERAAEDEKRKALESQFEKEKIAYESRRTSKAGLEFGDIFGDTAEGEQKTGVKKTKSNGPFSDIFPTTKNRGASWSEKDSGDIQTERNEDKRRWDQSTVWQKEVLSTLKDILKAIRGGGFGSGDEDGDVEDGSGFDISDLVDGASLFVPGGRRRGVVKRGPGTRSARKLRDAKKNSKVRQQAAEKLRQQRKAGGPKPTRMSAIHGGRPGVVGRVGSSLGSVGKGLFYSFLANTAIDLLTDPKNKAEQENINNFKSATQTAVVGSSIAASLPKSVTATTQAAGTTAKAVAPEAIAAAKGLTGPALKAGKVGLSALKPALKVLGPAGLLITIGMGVWELIDLLRTNQEPGWKDFANILLGMLGFPTLEAMEQGVKDVQETFATYDQIKKDETAYTEMRSAATQQSIDVVRAEKASAIARGDEQAAKLAGMQEEISISNKGLEEKRNKSTEGFWSSTRQQNMQEFANAKEAHVKKQRAASLKTAAIAGDFLSKTGLSESDFNDFVELDAWLSSAGIADDTMKRTAEADFKETREGTPDFIRMPGKNDAEKKMSLLAKMGLNDLIKKYSKLHSQFKFVAENTSSNIDEIKKNFNSIPPEIGATANSQPTINQAPQIQETTPNKKTAAVSDIISAENKQNTKISQPSNTPQIIVNNTQQNNTTLDDPIALQPYGKNPNLDRTQTASV